MRKISFAEGEFYHVYNRGTDKRPIFLDDQDLARFIQSMVEFNNLHPVGGLYVNSFMKKRLRHPVSKSRLEDETDEKKLVEVIAYCLNPNHFHLLLRQVSEKGIEKFMQRLGNGYTKYFNHKYERTGVLFQGKFKAVHVDSNEYLLHVSAYVNLNYRVHNFGSRTSKFQYRASWGEYIGEAKEGEKMCCTEPVLGQFRDRQDYIEFAESSLRGTLENRGLLQASDLLE